MSQAIQTKYLPPTNCRGSRIKAWCDRGSIVVGYHDEGSTNPHRYAMESLVRKFMIEDANQAEPRYCTPPEENPWRGPWVQGGLPGTTGDVFVSCFSDEAFTVTPEAK